MVEQLLELTMLRYEFVHHFAERFEYRVIVNARQMKTQQAHETTTHNRNMKRRFDRYSKTRSHTICNRRLLHVDLLEHGVVAGVDEQLGGALHDAVMDLELFLFGKAVHFVYEDLELDGSIDVVAFLHGADQARDRVMVLVLVLGVDDEYERAAALEESVAVARRIVEQVDLARAVVHLKGDERAARYVLEVRLGGRVELQRVVRLHLVKHHLFDGRFAAPGFFINK